MMLNFICWDVNKHKHHLKCAWYECVCGEFVLDIPYYLKRGHIKSCGCDNGRVLNYLKRMIPERQAFYDAKKRCNNPKNHAYAYYGGCGIKFMFFSFKEFFAELGKRPPGLSLDRIDNNGHYEKGNVRWATSQQQAENRRK